MSAVFEPIPAGWYTDPDEPADVRWWTGAEWTHHVQPRPLPPLPAAASAASAAAAAATAQAVPAMAEELVEAAG